MGHPIRGLIWFNYLATYWHRQIASVTTPLHMTYTLALRMLANAFRWNFGVRCAKLCQWYACDARNICASKWASASIKYSTVDLYSKHITFERFFDFFELQSVFEILEIFRTKLIPILREKFDLYIFRSDLFYHREFIHSHHLCRSTYDAWITDRLLLSL